MIAGGHKASDARSAARLVGAAKTGGNADPRRRRAPRRPIQGAGYHLRCLRLQIGQKIGQKIGQVIGQSAWSF